MRPTITQVSPSGIWMPRTTARNTGSLDGISIPATFIRKIRHAYVSILRNNRIGRRTTPRAFFDEKPNDCERANAVNPPCTEQPLSGESNDNHERQPAAGHGFDCVGAECPAS